MRDKIKEILVNIDVEYNLEKYIISLLEEQKRKQRSEIFNIQESYRKQYDWLKENYPEAYEGLATHHRESDAFKVDESIIVLDKEKLEEIILFSGSWVMVNPHRTPNDLLKSIEKEYNLNL
jgi:hypothetical protein